MSRIWSSRNFSERNGMNMVELDLPTQEKRIQKRRKSGRTISFCIFNIPVKNNTFNFPLDKINKSLELTK